MELLSYLQKIEKAEKVEIVNAIGKLLKARNGDMGNPICNLKDYIEDFMGFFTITLDGTIKCINFYNIDDILKDKNIEKIFAPINNYDELCPVKENYFDFESDLIAIVKRDKHNDLIWNEENDFDYKSDIVTLYDLFNIAKLKESKEEPKQKAIKKKTSRKRRKINDTKKQKWDRSKIMKEAHQIKKDLGLTLGEAIRESWNRAKVEKLKAIEATIAPVIEPVINTMPRKKSMSLQEAMQFVKEKRLNNATNI